MLKHICSAGLMMAAFVPLTFAEEIKLESSQEKVSYLIGRNIGQSLSRDGIELEMANLISGLKESIAGQKSQIPDAEAQVVMTAFQQKMQEKAAAKAAVAGEANEMAGTAFLMKNKEREGVKVTESGLQYEILTEGKGEKPAETDMVSVHYHGTLIDGTVFDSSVDRGTPAEFPVNGVIPGWVEALQLMPVGSKWKLAIPSDLAYGAQGAGGSIGPNSTLVFEVELLAIKSKSE